MTMEGGKQPLALYFGKVMHARLSPVVHRFTYKMASVLIDLDRLDEAGRMSPIFSVNRKNLVSFFEKHHGPRTGASLRDYVDGLCAGAGLERPARVELLCYPTVLGYTFNPLSVYFCRDADESIIALIYQVHNTFGESHIYVEPVISGQSGPAGIRQQRRKDFYVSPFIDMPMTYRFRVRPPGEEVSLRILETDGQVPVLSATFSGTRNAATTGRIISAVLQTCGITWKATAGIHFEALRLWLKGLRLHKRPSPPPPESYPDGFGKSLSGSRRTASRGLIGDAGA